MCGRKRLCSGLVEIAACDERRVVNGPDGLGMHMGDAATADERDAEASGLSSANLATIAQGITNLKRSRHTHDRPYPRMRIWRLGSTVFYTGYLDDEPSECSIPRVILAVPRSPILFSLCPEDASSGCWMQRHLDSPGRCRRGNQRLVALGRRAILISDGGEE